MDSKRIGIIGGTGLTQIPELVVLATQHPETPLGQTSAPLIYATLNGVDVVFLARHGHPHKLPPHKINYRANMWALKEAGVTSVIAVNAVGGITESMSACVLCVPDQIIDYTHSREHTYFDGLHSGLQHLDFTYPYAESLREQLSQSAKRINMPLVSSGVYGAVQGPRLETAAEIQRMKRDGCDLVGMTGMPEASLARELELPYVCIALVVNPAAGCSDELITMAQIEAVVEEGMKDVKTLLAAVLPAMS
jgi:5'-methylthioinosine phosphorylase